MKHIFTILFSLCLFPLLAADPGWSVRSSDFANSMNIVAVVKLDGTEQTSNTITVAAFAGTEIRGIETLGSMISAGKYYAFLTIYSNKGSGEEITFRAYKKDSDGLINLSNKIEFVQDKLTGSLGDPYVLTNTAASASFLSFGFSGISSNKQTDSSTKTIKIIVPILTDVSSLTPDFTLPDGSHVTVNGVKQQTGVSAQNFTNPVIYKITAADGTTISWTITIEKEEALGAVSVTDSDSEISVFPNPAVDFINIRNGKNRNSVAEIYTAEGKLIEKRIVSSELISIDISSYNQGKYTLLIRNKEQVISKGFIKE